MPYQSSLELIGNIYTDATKIRRMPCENQREPIEVPLYSRVLRRLENQRARAHGHILTPVHASGPDTRGPIGSGRGSRRRSSRCRLGVTAAAALRRGGRCRRSRSRVAATAALHREETGEAGDEVVDRTDGHWSSEMQIETRASAADSSHVDC